VSLAQLVRFLVVELTQLASNPKFDMHVVFMTNYYFSGRRRLYRQVDALGDQLRESQDKVGLVIRRCS
jgi:hypothetical protein